MSQFTLNDDVLSVIETIERASSLISRAQQDCSEIGILMVTPGDYLAWLEHTMEQHKLLYENAPQNIGAERFIEQAQRFIGEMRAVGVMPSDKIKEHLHNLRGERA